MKSANGRGKSNCVTLGMFLDDMLSHILSLRFVPSLQSGRQFAFCTERLPWGSM